MFIQRALVISTFAVAGCAGAVDQGPADMEGGEPTTSSSTEMAAPGAARSEPTASPDTQPAMMDLSMPFEVLDSADPGLQACLQFYLPVSGPHAGHAPSLSTPPADRRCERQDGGLVGIHMPAHSHGLVSLTGVGAYPFHIQVTTGSDPHAMQPVRLLSDAAIAAAYERAEGAFEIYPHTAVIETPADGSRVALRRQGGGEGPEAIYLDAEGRVTDGAESIAGGWALFVNLAEGAYEASMTHDELDCGADSLATWSTSPAGAIALLLARDPYLAPIVPNSVAHSNAFRCR